MIKKYVIIVLFAQCLSHAAQAPPRQHADVFNVLKQTEMLNNYLSDNKQEEKIVRKEKIKDFLRAGADVSLTFEIRNKDVTILQNVIENHDLAGLILLLEIALEPEFRSCINFDVTPIHPLDDRKRPFITLLIIYDNEPGKGFSVEDYCTIIALYQHNGGCIDVDDWRGCRPIALMCEQSTNANLLEALLLMGAECDSKSSTTLNTIKFLFSHVVATHPAMTTLKNAAAEMHNRFESVFRYRQEAKKRIISQLTTSDILPPLIAIVLGYIGWATAVDLKTAK